MKWLLRRKPQQTGDDEVHRYMADILQATKLRQSVMQRHILQPSKTTEAELARYDTEIAIMQKVHTELLSRRTKEYDTV